MTVSVLIGNSDDKLSQAAWAKFIYDVGLVVVLRSSCVYFSGFSLPTAAHQNACWVVECSDLAYLRQDLAELAAKYYQESIALVCGETEMVP